ncbi:MAG: DUF2292 domain-containing protein [Methylococcaceae bacterium]|mgnify:CR=1 FL=1|nr:DUF2292 domain-containing protein [Methylococcaceae bacterium]
MAFELNKINLSGANSQEISSFIFELVNQLKFGSVEIVVHDGRIVQIDKRERFRVEAKQGN